MEDQKAATKLIAEWFRENNPVEIDGIPVKAVLQRLQFFGLDINDFAQNAEPRRISAYQARLGIILRYPAKAPPSRVNMTWEIFNESAPFLRSIVYDRNAKPTEEFFVKDQPRFEWKRDGAPPIPHSFELDWKTAPAEMKTNPEVTPPIIQNKRGQLADNSKNIKSELYFNRYCFCLCCLYLDALSKSPTTNHPQFWYTNHLVIWSIFLPQPYPRSRSNHPNKTDRFNKPSHLNKQFTSS